MYLFIYFIEAFVHHVDQLCTVAMVPEGPWVFALNQSTQIKADDRVYISGTRRGVTGSARQDRVHQRGPDHGDWRIEAGLKWFGCFYHKKMQIPDLNNTGTAYLPVRINLPFVPSSHILVRSLKRRIFCFVFGTTARCGAALLRVILHERQFARSGGNLLAVLSRASRPCVPW